VLCLQDDIAERVLVMLKGAMAELRVGDPRRLDTDIGPVIDADALAALSKHVARMRERGAPVFQLALPEACAGGTFFPPTLIEIESIAQLSGEVFGPVLHVLRFRQDELEALVKAINATGYGLTHGIQTRIDETVEAIRTRVHAGNVYVNRNMIGAVVGVQPFGGEGLSGTGPKAGGPNYLRRLVRESPATAPTVGTELVLPGPTGETNTMSFAPRGRVACLATNEAELRDQIDAALATGNIALLSRSPMAERVAREFGPRCEIVSDALAAMPGAVLLAGENESARETRLRLAQDGGPIVPVVIADANGHYEASRLVLERTLSINTTASGGNASLLSLAETTE
jgi:RHH-type proline utilization regulon transcriptional repressor/proline dehydrogenase/delta 1-pyrroline-5-carboxylate dehydrogenase